MTRILAVANAAGSAGKTTTAVSLAALRAAAGQRVVLVDLDPQGSATWWLGVEVGENPTVGDVLLRRASTATVLQDAPGAPGVRVLPAARSLDADQVELAGVAAGREQRLAMALRGIDADLVVLDCPGSISTLTVSALVAAHHVIAVTRPTLKELDGLPQLEDVVTEVDAAFGTGLRVDAVVACDVPPASAGKLYTDALALLADEYGDLVAPTVRRSVRVPEAYARQVPVVLHDPAAGVSRDYQAVADHLVAQGVL